MPDRWMACTERLCLRQLQPGDAVQLSEVAEPGWVEAVAQRSSELALDIAR